LIGTDPLKRSRADHVMYTVASSQASDGLQTARDSRPLVSQDGQQPHSRILKGRAGGCLTVGPVRLTDWPDRERRVLSVILELAAVSRRWGAVLAFEGSIERRFRLVADVQGDLGYAVARRRERAGP
jgi:hypothetical protein